MDIQRYIGKNTTNVLDEINLLRAAVLRENPLDAIDRFYTYIQANTQDPFILMYASILKAKYQRKHGLHIEAFKTIRDVNI